MSERNSKAIVARCIGTNIMNDAWLNISHGDKNSTKKALRMVRGKAGQQTGTPRGMGVSEGELMPMQLKNSSDPRYRSQKLPSLLHLKNHMQSNLNSPVVSNSNDFLQSLFLQDFCHMAAHALHRVGIKLFWLIRITISQQVRCHNAIPGFSELRDLVPPVPARAWKSVKQEKRWLLGVRRGDINEGISGTIVEPC